MTIAQQLEQIGINKGINIGEKKGFEKGKQEGRQEGRLEERQAIARQLRNMGQPFEKILEATGISEEKLKTIVHDVSAET
ncbi:hypothetical protein L2D25_21035 [Salmonella enterica subsp. enterica serovar Muenchen]|uniref:hypothetical protein n=1 Tax=Salmonella enterica TaxID=28901 RepID=UPI001F0E3751|nr:hypothetical protein [Salmonella enterica]MCH5443928.1 hypothetical protein [Salmonella enterica subsp. enterica serovar Muenchen]